MLSTTRCGHCKQAKAFINSKYPDLTEDQFTYFQYDADQPTDESRGVLGAAQQLGIRGVPFTVLIEGKEILKAVRGYDRVNIQMLLDEVVGDVKEIDG